MIVPQFCFDMILTLLENTNQLFYRRPLNLDLWAMIRWVSSHDSSFHDVNILLMVTLALFTQWRCWLWCFLTVKTFPSVINKYFLERHFQFLLKLLSTKFSISICHNDGCVFLRNIITQLLSRSNLKLMTPHFCYHPGSSHECFYLCMI